MCTRTSLPSCTSTFDLPGRDMDFSTFVVLAVQCFFVKHADSAPCGRSGCSQNDTFPRILTRPNATNQGLFPGLGERDIIFPDELHKTIAPLSAAPKCANGLSFCENIETYPYRRVKDLLGKNDHSEFFGVDEAPPELANRIGEPDENFICGSIDATIFPKAGKNKNNKWKYIINQGEQEGYIQGIRIERCAKLNGPCNLIAEAPLGYVASCKQKFVLRRLLSLSDNGQPAPDSFQIPSACCCSFKKDFGFFSNFGRSASPAGRPPR